LVLIIKSTILTNQNSLGNKEGNRPKRLDGSFSVEFLTVSPTYAIQKSRGDGLVKAKILSANNFIIKFVIPKTAISGPILYKTIVEEEALPRGLNFGTIEIRK